MKNIFLLIVVITIAMAAGAQDFKIDAAPVWRSFNQKNIHQAAAKGTSGGGRWYSYGSAIDTSQEYQMVVVDGFNYEQQFLTQTTIWPDTNGTVLDSSGVYQHVTEVCEAAVFDPTAALFNIDLDEAYVGEIWVTPADAYVWDSVSLLGKYFYNKTKTPVVDTLRLVFLTGSGGPAGSDDIFAGVHLIGGHYASDSNFEMKWDGLHNTVCTHTFTRPDSMDIYLTAADWIDTNASGLWSKSVALPAAISVPAGGYCGMSVTFISGDLTARGVGGLLNTPTPGDTLLGAVPEGGNNRYNVWRPVVSYYQTLGGTAAWAPYPCPVYLIPSSDHNLGYWKNLPNVGIRADELSPTWEWSSGGGASSLQYPTIDFHVTCTTCGLVMSPRTGLGTNNITVVNSVKASPNPATDELNITYELSQSSDITVSLTNMLGQVVATQKVNNKAAGNVVFNTAGLAGGIYVYTLSANGNVTTGRVAVAH